MVEIRVQGLVRLMRWARAQLGAGVPPERADSFRAAVQQALRQVDQLLVRTRGTPDRLPRPSRDAYLFLKSIDLQHLPPPKPSRPARRGLRAAVGEIQDAMLAALPAYRAGETTRVQAETLAAVQAAYQQFEAARLKKGLPLEKLTGPTRQAAAWLALLCDPQQLALHLRALERLESSARQAAPKISAVHAVLDAQTFLFRSNRSGGTLEIHVHEGFIAAPDAVLDALAELAAASRGRSRQLQVVRAFANGPEFLALSQRLAADSRGRGPSASGRHRDLESSFTRVNREYFGGQMPRPHLAWKQRVTYREFGHYRPGTDTVSISLSLDDPAVPEYVLDYVVYHELLHKQMGVKMAAGRQVSHPPEFHRAEKKFSRYTEAKAFLRKLAERIATGRANC